MSTPSAPRSRSAKSVRLDEAYLLSPENAAAYLGQIGKTSLDRLVTAGRITPRQISPGRVGFLRRELEAFADALPSITPGLPRPTRGEA